MSTEDHVPFELHPHTDPWSEPWSESIWLGLVSFAWCFLMLSILAAG